jgi:STE24 endopeptidase
MSQASHLDTKPSSPPTPGLDPARQTKARALASQRRGLSYFETILLSLYFVTWMIGGVSRLIAYPLRAFGAPWWAGVVVQVVAFGLPAFLISLPFRYLGTFALPRHFGILTQPLRGWLTDLAKEIALFGIVGTCSMLGVYALLHYAPDLWWLWAAAAFTLYGVVLTALLPVILLPMVYRTRPLGSDRADLVERLTALAQRARARVRGVFSLELSSRTPAATAVLLGLGRTRRILLADTLLTNFTDDEIETVMAHELAHHVHRDIPVGIVVQSVLGLAALKVADVAYRAYASAASLKSLDDPVGLPFFLMILVLAFFATSPFARLYSRWRERRADTFALEATRKPEAFASAMTRFANLNLAVASPSGLASHPSLASRIRKAEAFAAKLRDAP